MQIDRTRSSTKHFLHLSSTCLPFNNFKQNTNELLELGSSGTPDTGRNYLLSMVAKLKSRWELCHGASLFMRELKLINASCTQEASSILTVAVTGLQTVTQRLDGRPHSSDGPGPESFSTDWDGDCSNSELLGPATAGLPGTAAAAFEPPMAGLDTEAVCTLGRTPSTTAGDRCTGRAGSYHMILKVMGLLTPDKSESGQSLTYLGLNRLVLFPVGSVLAEALSGQEALSWSLLASLDAIFPVVWDFLQQQKSSLNPIQDCFGQK